MESQHCDPLPVWGSVAGSKKRERSVDGDGTVHAGLLTAGKCAFHFEILPGLYRHNVPFNFAATSMTTPSLN